MHELYELKEMLCKELKEYGEKGEMSTGTLDVVDKLAHTIKNLDKIIEGYEEEGYSSRSYSDGMGGGYRAYPRYMRGGSYARGGNARRDSMGRYSRDGGYNRDDGMVEELRRLMNDAPNDSIKHDIQRLVDKIEQQM